ncbi:lamin tail domain-containing protein, partial [Marinifilum caeruleilacunae]
IRLIASQTVELKFENRFPDGVPFQLKINGVTDECENALDTIVNLTYHEIHPFDVVINEIMADESPSQGLPEFEYIELYNTMDYPISLENWILQIGEKQLFFAADTIKANSYLILCSHAGREAFSNYGKVVSLSNFGGLTNTGNTVRLISAQERIIDEITYSDSWYQSVEKSNGGWSLERIDPMNHTWQEPNWTASMSENGGTPGSVNSVLSDNKDIVSPEIKGVEILSNNSIVLEFSEPMIEKQAMLETNYVLEPHHLRAEKINKSEGNETGFVLIFTESFIKNSKYKLMVSENVTDLAGHSLQNNQKEFWVPAIIKKGDLVINELLFNPFPEGSDYVEIYNRSKNICDLSHLFLGKKDENYRVIDSVRLSEKSVLLFPEQYCLFSIDTLTVSDTYFTSNSKVFYQVDLPNYPNKEGRAVLFTKDNLIDEFEYSESMHFELLASKEGVALERIHPDLETNSGASWQSAAQNVGFGTPGLKNSVYRDLESSKDEVSLSTKVFSPDNDGVDDRLYINFKLKDEGFVANVRVFNSMGKEIRKLANNLYLAKEDQIFWDGLNAKRERLPIGIYLLYIEMFNPDGEVKSFKKTCVIGGNFK